MSIESLRSVAAGLQDLAGKINDVGVRALMEAGIDWHSVAADAYRDQMMERGQAARACARRFQDAADAVALHAEECWRATQKLREMLL